MQPITNILNKNDEIYTYNFQLNKKRKITEVETTPSARQLEAKVRKIEKFPLKWEEGKPQELIPLLTSLGLTEEKAQRSIKVLKELGLTEKNIGDIAHFYISKKQPLLNNLCQSAHFRKGAVGTSHSLVYIPGNAKAPMRGLYILCKSHQVGLGSFNKAVLAVHLDTGKKAVFRTARSKDVSNKEISVNKIASCYPKYFAAGTPVFYEGSWRDRYELKYKNKNDILKINNIMKVGFIMPFCEGGELWKNYLAPTATRPPLTLKERIKIAYKYSEELSFFHDELKCVHLDQKPMNIFLTGNKSPRMADFGFVTELGKKADLVGTRGYLAPELIICGDHPSVGHVIDMWSLGCILADLVGNTVWKDWILKMEGNWKACYDHISQSKGEGTAIWLANWLDEKKKKAFPGWNNPDTVDYWIFKCLMLLANERPDAKTVASKLKEIYDKMPG
jgi:Protein kinase domain